MMSGRVSSCAAWFAATALAGCSYPPLPNTSGGGTPGDGPAADTRLLPPSSPILLSEVVLAPLAAQLIEIVNPTKQSFDLSNHYLSDSGNYFRLPMGTSVDAGDFIAKFPDHAVIPGHGVVTVAFDTSDEFNGIYSARPTFSFADGSMQVIAGNAPVLDKSGEPIILFQWDGQSDLVTDVDIMIVGAPTATNRLINKSGMSQKGPNVDSPPRTYASDANTLQPQAEAPMNPSTLPPFSTQRILLEDGHETHGGTGNGQSGDDETSEDTSVTWDLPPFSKATPNEVPPQLLR